MNNKNTLFKYDRIKTLMTRVIDEVVTQELVDVRVCGKVDVVDVEVSHDFSFCKVFVYIKGQNKKEVLEGLKSSKGFVRHALNESLALRKVPDIMFVEDTTVEKRNRIEEILKRIHENEANKQEEAPNEVENSI